MGRELKRVALDFDWPLRETWEGFLRPDSPARHRCEPCDGTGSSPEARRLHDQWYGNAPFDPASTGSTPWTITTPAIWALTQRNVARMREEPPGVECVCGVVITSADQARQHFTDHPDWRIVMKPHSFDFIFEAQRLCKHFNHSWSHHIDADDVRALLDADRLADFTHNPRTEEQKSLPRHENGWLKESNGYVPTPAEVNEWSLSGFGHDSINSWVVIAAKCKRLGLPETCAICDGHGETWDSTEAKAAYDAWEKTEPPAGEGYQVWETVSEGSPVSPVFVTPEALAEWLVRHEGYSRKAATAFCGEGGGWAPSLIMADGVMYNDIEAAAILVPKTTVPKAESE